MAFIVFGGGHELPVTQSAAEILEKLEGANDGNEHPLDVDGRQVKVSGFAVFTLAADRGLTQVFVRPAAVAYVRPEETP